MRRVGNATGEEGERKIRKLKRERQRGQLLREKGRQGTFIEERRLSRREGRSTSYWRRRTVEGGGGSSKPRSYMGRRAGEWEETRSSGDAGQWVLHRSSAQGRDFPERPISVKGFKHSGVNYRKLGEHITFMCRDTDHGHIQSSSEKGKTQES